MRLNVNTDALFRMTDKLDRIGKFAIPTAAKRALNDVVFDVKTNTMPNSASNEFTQRQKNFFTANSRFESAKGMKLKELRASVGFYENRLVSQGSNFAVKDLEQQEHGGSIDGKAFIPTIFARRGNNHRGLVKPNARIKAIRKKGIVEAKEIKGKFHNLTKRQQFIAAANKAGPGGHVLYNGFLYRVFNVMGKRVEAVPLYSVKANRSVKVKPTRFMEEASMRSAKKLPDLYSKHGQKLVQKYYGKV